MKKYVIMIDTNKIKTESTDLFEELDNADLEVIIGGAGFIVEDNLALLNCNDLSGERNCAKSQIVKQQAE